MRTLRIYTQQTLRGSSDILLEPGPSQHLARVLRVRLGDSLILFNGRGGEYPAEVAAIGKKQVTVRTGVHLAHECESGLSIHLGIAIGVAVTKIIVS